MGRGVNAGNPLGEYKPRPICLENVRRTKSLDRGKESSHRAANVHASSERRGMGIERAGPWRDRRIRARRSREGGESIAPIAKGEMGMSARRAAKAGGEWRLIRRQSHWTLGARKWMRIQSSMEQSVDQVVVIGLESQSTQRSSFSDHAGGATGGGVGKKAPMSGWWGALLGTLRLRGLFVGRLGLPAVVVGDDRGVRYFPALVAVGFEAQFGDDGAELGYF